VALVAASACGPSPSTEPSPDDRDHYRASLTAPTRAEAGAHCTEVRDPALRGDCAAALTARDGPRDPSWCDRLTPDGLWNEECWFVAADDPDEPLDVRWERCAHAGRFQEPCTVHQRKREADAIGETVRFDDAETVFTAAEAVQALVLRPPAAATDGQEQTWRAFWRAAHLTAPDIDPGVCSPLPLSLSTPCAAATEWLVRRAVRQAERRDPDRICGPDPRLSTLPIANGAATVVGAHPAVQAWAEAAWRDARSRCTRTP
jgi:hypothetical protein